MTTGKPPFEAGEDTDPDFAVRQAHLNETPVRPKRQNPELSEQLEGVILASLEKNPDDRIPGCSEFRRLLEEAVASRAVPPKSPRGFPWKAAIAVLAALVVVTMFTLLMKLDRGQSLPNLGGKWYVENTIKSTTYNPYIGLKVGYVMYLTQNGKAISGNFEKDKENGTLLKDKARTEGLCHGTVNRNAVALTFSEKGQRRETIGEYSWMLQDDGSLVGTFSSTAADTRGSSVARRQ
jgi:hypothetical protein